MKKVTGLILILCLLLPCAAAMADPAYVRVTRDTKTYAGPGTGFFDTGITLSRGTYVTVLAKTWDYPNDMYWLLVEFKEYGNTFRAYIGEKNVTGNLSAVPEEEALGVVYATADLDVFAGPGWEYAMWNDTVYRGTGAVLLAYEDGYAFIECWNDRWDQAWRVWAPLSELDCSGVYIPGDNTFSAYTTPNGIVTGVYPVGHTCRIGASSANARSGAGTEYAVVEYVFCGERFTILATDVASNGKTWYQIRKDGNLCWISSGICTVE